MAKKLIAITTIFAVLCSFGLISTVSASASFPDRDDVYLGGYNQDVVDYKSSINIEEDEEVSDQGKIGVTVKAIKNGLEKVW